MKTSPKVLFICCCVVISILAISATGCTGSKKSSTIPTTTTTATTSSVTTILDNIPPMVKSVTPADGSKGIPIDSIISVIFNEAMDPSSITTGIFTLTDGKDKISGMVTYSGTTAIFTPSSELVAGIRYTVSISIEARDLAGNKLGTSFSWGFTTGELLPGPDETPTVTPPPSVISVSPVKGEENVDVNSKIEIFLSGDMDAASITTDSIIASITATKARIEGTVEYSSGKAVFAPASPLNYETTYTFGITRAVKNKEGIALAEEYYWSFRTMAKPDTTAPAVVSVSPKNLSKDVLPNTSLTATFNEIMDAVTVNAATFLLHKGTTPIEGKVSLADNKATFTPGQPLIRGTTYNVTLTTGMKDTAGNPIEGNYHWIFTVQSLSSGGGGGGGSAPTTTKPIKTLELGDDSLPNMNIEGLELHYVIPSAKNSGTAEIKATYSGFDWSAYLGITDGLLWMANMPSRDLIAAGMPSLLPFYDSLEVSECAVYNENDQKYWFFALPSWLDIGQYDPEVTEIPTFVSLSSTAGKMTVKYQIKD